MATVIEQIANQAAEALPGVDWEALEERFGMPREQLVFDVGTPGKQAPEETGAFAYDVFIKAALARAEVQLSQIVLTSQVKDDPATRENEVVVSMHAWEEVQHEAVTVGNVVLRAFQAGQDFLSQSNSFVVPLEAYRAIVTSTYITCLYGAVVHARKLMQLEDFSGEEIVASAENVTQTLNALAMLGEMGALNPLKPKATGVTAPAVITVAIASVLAIGLICFAIVTVQEEQNRNQLIRLFCEDSVRRGESVDRCKELMELNDLGHRGGPVALAAEKIGSTSVKVGLVLLALLVVPKLVNIYTKRR